MVAVLAVLTPRVVRHRRLGAPVEALENDRIRAADRIARLRVEVDLVLPAEIAARTGAYLAVTRCGRSVAPAGTRLVLRENDSVDEHEHRPSPHILFGGDTRGRRALAP